MTSKLRYRVRGVDKACGCGCGYVCVCVSWSQGGVSHKVMDGRIQDMQNVESKKVEENIYRGVHRLNRLSQ